MSTLQLFNSIQGAEHCQGRIEGITREAYKVRNKCTRWIPVQQNPEYNPDSFPVRFYPCGYITINIY